MSSISGTDDDVMRHQQERDLGHPTKPQADKARDVTAETEEARLASDVRANKAVGRAFGRPKKSETEKAAARAAERKGS